MTLLTISTELFLITIVWSYINSALFLSKSISTINYITGNAYHILIEAKHILLLNINPCKNQSVAIYSLILTSEAPNVTQGYMTHFQEDLLRVKEIGYTVFNTLVENASLLLNSYTISFLFLITVGIKPIESSIRTFIRLMPQPEKEMPWKEGDEEEFSYGGGFGQTTLKPKTWKDFVLLMVPAAKGVARSTISRASGSVLPSGGGKGPKKKWTAITHEWNSSAAEVQSHLPSSPSSVHATPVQSCAVPLKHSVWGYTSVAVGSSIVTGVAFLKIHNTLQEGLTAAGEAGAESLKNDPELFQKISGAARDIVSSPETIKSAATVLKEFVKDEEVVDVGAKIFKKVMTDPVIRDSTLDFIKEASKIPEVNRAMTKMVKDIATDPAVVQNMSAFSSEFLNNPANRDMLLQLAKNSSISIEHFLTVWSA